MTLFPFLCTYLFGNGSRSLRLKGYCSPDPPERFPYNLYQYVSSWCFLVNLYTEYPNFAQWKVWSFLKKGSCVCSPHHILKNAIYSIVFEFIRQKRKNNSISRSLAYLHISKLSFRIFLQCIYETIQNTTYTSFTFGTMTISYIKATK